jgi:signal peptidase II
MIATNHGVRYGAMLVIVASCLGCDQITKHIAKSRLEGQPPRSFFGDVFRLEYAENPGAFLGLGGQLPPAARWAVLVAANGLLALGIAGVLVWHTRLLPLQWIACALLLSGSLGNWVDRLRFDGLVIDFLNLGLGPVRTGIFNVADMAITAGAVLLVWPTLAGRQRATDARFRRD